MLQYSLPHENTEPVPDLRNPRHGILLQETLSQLAAAALAKAQVQFEDHQMSRAQALADMSSSLHRSAGTIAEEVRRLEDSHIHGADCEPGHCHRDANLAAANAFFSHRNTTYGESLRIRRTIQDMPEEAAPLPNRVDWYETCEALLIHGPAIIDLAHRHHLTADVDPAHATAIADTAADVTIHMSQSFEPRNCGMFPPWHPWMHENADDDLTQPSEIVAEARAVLQQVNAALASLPNN